MKGWYGNSMKHGLASKGIKTDNNLKEIKRLKGEIFKTEKDIILSNLNKLYLSYKEDYDEKWREYGDGVEDFQVHDDIVDIVDLMSVIRYSANNMDDVKRFMLEYKVHWMNDKEGVDIWLNQVFGGEE